MGSDSISSIGMRGYAGSFRSRSGEQCARIGGLFFPFAEVCLESLAFDCSMGMSDDLRLTSGQGKRGIAWEENWLTREVEYRPVIMQTSVEATGCVAIRADGAGAMTRRSTNFKTVRHHLAFGYTFFVGL